MSALAEETCVACRKHSLKASETEIQEFLGQTEQWTVVERESIQRLERVFRFANFAEALAFTTQVGALAEEQNHHPAILTEWGRVTVATWTHSIGGLHRNDFILAAKIDKIPRTL